MKELEKIDRHERRLIVGEKAAGMERERERDCLEGQQGAGRMNRKS